jgi:hypothetical protein
MCIYCGFALKTSIAEVKNNKPSEREIFSIMSGLSPILCPRQERTNLAQSIVNKWGCPLPSGPNKSLKQVGWMTYAVLYAGLHEESYTSISIIIILITKAGGVQSICVNHA